MVIDSHDVVVFITYNQFGEIEGINFHYGSEVINQDFKKPCPHVTELFNRVSGEYSPHKNKSEKKRILFAVKLFTDAFIVGTL
jgi:diaminopimelate decarboxylase